MGFGLTRRFNVVILSMLLLSLGISGSSVLTLNLYENSENPTFMPNLVISEFSRSFIEFASAIVIASSDTGTTPEDTPLTFLYAQIVTVTVMVSALLGSVLEF